MARKSSRRRSRRQQNLLCNVVRSAVDDLFIVIVNLTRREIVGNRLTFRRDDLKSSDVDWNTVDDVGSMRIYARLFFYVRTVWCIGKFPERWNFCTPPETRKKRCNSKFYSSVSDDFHFLSRVRSTNADSFRRGPASCAPPCVKHKHVAVFKPRTGSERVTLRNPTYCPASTSRAAVSKYLVSSTSHRLRRYTYSRLSSPPI